MDLAGAGSRALHLRNFRQGLLRRLPYGSLRDTGLFQQWSGQAPLLFEQGEQDMFDINALMIPAHRLSGSGLQRLLELDGHSIHIHRYGSSTYISSGSRPCMAKS